MLTLPPCQDYSHRLSLVISEQSSQLQELRRQTSSREQELQQLRRDRDRETGGETEHLRGLLKEKEALIQVRVHRFDSVRSAPPPPSTTPSSHVTYHDRS